MAVGSESVPEAMAVFGSQLKDVYRVRGEWADLAGMAELMAAAAAQNPGLPVLRAALARTFCDLGQRDDANALIDADIADGFAAYSYDPSWMSAITALSETCVSLGRADGATLLHDWLRPWRGQVAHATVTSQGPVAFHLGCLATLLERPDDAEGYFAEALEVSQRMAFPYWRLARRSRVHGWCEGLRRAVRKGGRHARRRPRDRPAVRLNGLVEVIAVETGNPAE